MGCGANDFFSRPVVTGSHGLSSDNRPFGDHFLDAVSSLPKCDVVVNKTAVMFNRDWYRNIWHRVANDLYPAYKALRFFGLEKTPKEDLIVVHLDFAEKTYEDVYNGLVSPNSLWLRDLPKAQNVVCFQDVLFMVAFVFCFSPLFSLLGQ